MIGKQRASEVTTQYVGNDLAAILAGEQITVGELRPWIARFQDIFVDGCIFLPPEISSRHRRVLIAHCLGHHFMHDGNQVWLRGFDSTWSRKQEIQAEEFTAYLLIPEYDCQGGARMIPPKRLAMQFEVTEDIAKLRVALSMI